MKATKCQCGAVTVEMDCESYSMPASEYRLMTGKKRAPNVTTYNCNYCANHWGIDLCGCGSGEKFGKCDNKTTKCTRRAQDINLHVQGCSTDRGGWGSTGANHRSPFGMGA